MPIAANTILNALKNADEKAITAAKVQVTSTKTKEEADANLALIDAEISQYYDQLIKKSTIAGGKIGAAVGAIVQATSACYTGVTPPLSQMIVGLFFAGKAGSSLGLSYGNQQAASNPIYQQAEALRLSAETKAAEFAPPPTFTVPSSTIRRRLVH